MTSGFERSQEKLLLFPTLSECPQGGGTRFYSAEKSYGDEWNDRSRV
jgi:hypothetical protein